MRIFIKRVWSILRRPFPDKRREREMDEEMRFHLEMLEHEHREQGLDPEQARRAARRDFGAVSRAKEECREAWGGAAVAVIGRAFRQWIRLLTLNPSSAAMAIGAFALGVALVTIMFSCLNSYLLKGMPFPEADRLVHVGRMRVSDGSSSMEMPFRDYLRSRRLLSALEECVAFKERTVSFRGTGLPRRCPSFMIAGDFLKMLRVGPVVGEGFPPGGDAAAGRLLVLISHRLWREEFDADPGVVGTTVWVDGEPRTVTGVMPADFRFIRDNDIWMPWPHESAAAHNDTDGSLVVVSGRLATASNRAIAQQEAAEVFRRLDDELPRDSRRYAGAQLTPLHHAVLGPSMIRRLWLLQAFSFFVLIIGSSNVANLLLVRFASRRRELAIRGTFGATPRQVAGVVVSECLLFSTCGGLLGAFLAYAGMTFLWNHMSAFAPAWVQPFAFDGASFAFVLAATITASFAAATWPAMQASRTRPADLLRDDERTGTGITIGRFSRSLVVVQLGLSFTLILCAGLLTRAVGTMEDIPLPFDPGRIHTARVVLRGAPYDDAGEADRFYANLVNRIRHARPEIGAIGLTTRQNLDSAERGEIEVHPAGGTADRTPVRREVYVESISAEYFEALGVGMLSGRSFQATDSESNLPVAVVNRSMARELWPGEDPVGRLFQVPESGEWLTVVGVAPDLRMQGAMNFLDSGAGYYRPLSQSPDDTLSVVVDSPVPLPDWQRFIREAVFSLDTNQAPKDIGTLQASLDDDLPLPRIISRLLLAFAIAAAFLAATGVYGLMSFAIAHRMKEFAIRTVCGALPGQLVSLVFRQGGRLFVAGSVAGALLFIVTGRLLARTDLLGPVSLLDPAVLFFTVALVAGTLVAAILPSVRRTLVLRPMDILRSP